jgi:hypothetical protein
MLRKIPALRATIQTKTLVHLAHRIKIKGAAVEVEGEAAEAEAIKRKESGTAFFTKRMMCRMDIPGPTT